MFHPAGTVSLLESPALQSQALACTGLCTLKGAATLSAETTTVVAGLCLRRITHPEGCGYIVLITANLNFQQK
jgi:hypothetical protein